jgi:hypothetical protein
MRLPLVVELPESAERLRAVGRQESRMLTLAMAVIAGAFIAMVIPSSLLPGLEYSRRLELSRLPLAAQGIVDQVHGLISIRIWGAILLEGLTVAVFISTMVLAELIYTRVVRFVRARLSREYGAEYIEARLYLCARDKALARWMWRVSMAIVPLAALAVLVAGARGICFPCSDTLPPWILAVLIAAGSAAVLLAVLHREWTLRPYFPTLRLIRTALAKEEIALCGLWMAVTLVVFVAGVHLSVSVAVPAYERLIVPQQEARVAALAATAEEATEAGVLPQAQAQWLASFIADQEAVPERTEARMRSFVRAGKQIGAVTGFMNMALSASLIGLLWILSRPGLRAIGSGIILVIAPIGLPFVIQSLFPPSDTYTVTWAVTGVGLLSSLLFGGWPAPRRKD